MNTGTKIWTQCTKTVLDLRNRTFFLLRLLQDNRFLSLKKRSRSRILVSRGNRGVGGEVQQSRDYSPAIGGSQGVHPEITTPAP